jgi:hypothetical protein
MSLMELEGLEITTDERAMRKPAKKTISIEKVMNGFIVCNLEGYSSKQKAIAKSMVEAKKLANKFLGK